nr:MAG TPA: hypothetical protein [Caudoviricetes sp.]
MIILLLLYHTVISASPLAFLILANSLIDNLSVLLSQMEAPSIITELTISDLSYRSIFYIVIFFTSSIVAT